MAQDSFKNTLYGLITILLFTSLLIGFAVRSGGEYNKDSSELTDNKINLTSINKTLADAETEAEKWKDTFSQPTFLGVTGLVITGGFKLFLLMLKFLVTPFNLLSQMLINVLGIPLVVAGVIVFLFIVSVILGIWRLIKQGD